MSYFGKNNTLAQVGKEIGVTRERIRQINNRTAVKLWQRINQNPGIYLQSAILVAKNLGDQLSLESWKKLLIERKIIGEDKSYFNLDSFSILCALLRSVDKVKLSPKITINENLHLALSMPTNSTLGIKKAIDQISTTSKRKIRQIISYVGGIHLKEASEILKLNTKQTTDVLRYLGYREVISNWYTITSEDSPKRWPMLKAGLPMMEVCGPIEFDDFCDGLRRYISRFYDTLAPPKVIKAHLVTLGFELEDNYVCWPETPVGYLADSEKCFIDVVDKYGPVVNYLEVLDFFQENGYSNATATIRVIGQSPIVERVEFGLYKIRGQNHNWEDIERAKNRQIPIAYNPEVIYGMDGIVRYRITIGSWALGGVISISANQQPLPDLGAGWKILVNEQDYGVAKRDDYMIWGLGAALNALNVQIEDRIELAFDPWEEPVVRIRKL